MFSVLCSLRHENVSDDKKKYRNINWLHQLHEEKVGKILISTYLYDHWGHLPNFPIVKVCKQYNILVFSKGYGNIKDKGHEK